MAEVFTGQVMRDLAAVILLVMTLVMPWNYSGTGGENTWVLLTVLLAFLALGATYVLRPSVIGRTVPPDQIGLLRLGSMAPLFLVVLVALVRGLAQGSGIGVAVATAAAAVILVAQYESAGTHAVAVPWTVISGGSYLAVGAWLVIGVLATVRELLSSLWGWGALLPFLGLGVALGWVGFRVLRKVAAAWAGGLFLAAALLVSFVSLPGGMGGAQEYSGSGASADPIAGGMMTLTLLAAAASLGPGVYRSLVPRMEGETRWMQAVIGVLSLMSILAVAALLQVLFMLMGALREGYAEMNAKVVFTLLFAVLYVAAVILCRQRFVTDPISGRRLTVWTLAGLCLAALVLYAATGTGLSLTSLALHFLTPVIIIGLLTIPADVRRAYGPLLPAASQPSAIS